MDDILFLFDIDGTIINLMGCHRKSYQKAVMEVFGVQLSLNEIKKGSGRPTKDIIRIPMTKLGISTERKVNEAVERYFENFKIESTRLIKEKDVFIKGVKEFLEKSKKAGIKMGIVTGNMGRVGKFILEKCDLLKYFDDKFIFYSDGKASRIEILKEAKDASKKFDKVIVFGDTNLDVEAAKKNRLRIVLVSEKENTDANLVIKNFENFEKVIKKLQINL